jgi:hypothetical protein
MPLERTLRSTANPDLLHAICKPDGSKQHVITVAPQTAEDADVIVRCEKRNSSQISAPAAETRSIYFMIHTLAPAASH